MKKVFSLLMIVCLAVSFSVGLVGCQEQGPTGVDDSTVEEELTPEEEALEAAIGEDQPEQEEETVE